MKYFFQENRYDCGAACVATILSYFDMKEELSTITQECRTSTKGTTLYDMKQVLSQHGVKFEGCECSKNDFNNLIEQDHRPIKRRNKFYQSLRTASSTIKGMEIIRGIYKKNRRNGTLFGFSVSTEIKVLMGIPA